MAAQSLVVSILAAEMHLECSHVALEALTLIDQTPSDISYKVRARAAGLSGTWVIGWDIEQPWLHWCYTPKEWTALSRGHLPRARRASEIAPAAAPPLS